MEQLHNFDIETLIALAERIAEQTEGGHLTILRFTTEWKCGLGTPCLDSSDGRQEVADLPGFPTLREALVQMITHQQRIGSLAGVGAHRRP